MKPQRIPLHRRKGYRLQASSVALNGLPAVNCARPGRWGNPFKGALAFELALRDACLRLILFVPNKSEKMAWMAEHLHELRHKNLACWCKPTQPCHADVLLSFANPK